MTNGKLSLIAVGDIFLQTKNGEHPFQKVSQALYSKDILFANLETVLSNQGKEEEKAVQLYTSPDKVKYLKESGFDVLNIANNHIMDLGLQGFAKTLTVLNRNNLTFIGAGNERFSQSQAIIERGDMKFGLLGYLQVDLRTLKKKHL